MSQGFRTRLQLIQGPVAYRMTYVPAKPLDKMTPAEQSHFWRHKESVLACVPYLAQRDRMARRTKQLDEMFR